MLGLHGHACALPQDADELLSAWVPYVRIGLSRGEKCVAVCGEDTGKELLDGLRRAGIDIGSALARGAVLVTRDPVRHPREGGFDPDALVGFFRSSARLAASENYSGLRLCVDMTFALGKKTSRDRLTEYQRKLHDFLSKQNSLCLCAFRRDGFPADTLLDALRAHPHVVIGGQAAENFYFVPPEGVATRAEASRLLHQRLGHLLERQGQITRILRQADRLSRFRDIAASLLSRAAVPDLLNRIAEGVVALGYRMCWIGMAREDGTVEPVASCGDREGYLRQLPVRWDDSPLGNGPAGTAIRKGKPDVVRDVSRSARFEPWRAPALARGYLSVAAVPLREGETVIGALVVYAPARDAFGREAIEELVAFVLQASLVLHTAREYRRLAESEARFRAVVENANVIALETDPEGKILLFNRAAVRITGVPAADAVGRGYLDFIAGPERERVEGTFREVLAGKEKEGYVATILTREGAERSLAWNATAIRNADGSVRCVVWLGVDMTERLRAEREKEELRRNLVQAQKMEAVGAVAGGIAHEFNNLLASIIGYASLLESEMDPDEPRLPTVRRIRTSAERASELTRKLIGFSRRGKYQVHLLSFNDVVAGALPLLRESLGRGIEVQTELDPAIGSVEGDDGQLRRCFLDLCYNARDAMPRGGTLTIRTGTLRIEAGETERYHVREPKDYAFLEVKDTGEGMAAEVQKHIFEPFFTTWRETGHAGLGLSSVYGIVKNHNGGIHVESSPGEGSLFRIYLPVAASREAPADPPPGEDYPKGTETILIVDDEPEIREMGSELLGALGYRTDAAGNGEEACRIFRERGREIDLVLLDIIMPKMGGKETFVELRKLSPGLPVLLASGYSMEGVAREILEAGANGFLQKPYGLSELAKKIRGILDAERPMVAGQAGTGA
jgi:PAS domain S-box-containing protein